MTDFHGYTRHEFRVALAMLGLKPGQFAKLVGHSPVTVYGWGRGPHGIPYWVPLLVNTMIQNRELKQALARVADKESA